MKVTLCHPNPGEPGLELLGLGATAGSALWAGAWLTAGLPLPRCAFHAITGCPCPTCGGTRCVLALLHGRIAEAASWNPMVFTGLFAAVLFSLYAAAVLLFKLPRLRLRFSPAEARILRYACLFIISTNWLYEIHHGV